MSKFSTTTGEYQGHKTITVNDDDGKRVITIGIKKAKAILGSLEDLKKFVEENDVPVESNNEI